MSSPHVPAGPREVAPTSQTSQSVTSPTVTHQSSSSSIGISPASTASIAVFLSLITLATLAITICWVRKRRTVSKVSDERPLEKAAVHDVEALAATRPIVPATPLPDVRWTPQIRSISGPMPDEDWDRKSAALHPKRARSPPPSNFIKPRNLFPDPYPKSAPAHAPSFSQNETPHPAKSWRGELSPPVTPQALAVSGMQTRSLGRPGLGSKELVM